MSEVLSIVVGIIGGAIAGWMTVRERLVVVETTLAALGGEIGLMRQRIHDIANVTASNDGRIELDEERLGRLETILSGRPKR